jgi:hypothetical protein
VNYWISTSIVLVILISFLLLFVIKLKSVNFYKKSEIPPEAIPVTGANFVYMWIWEKENRINFVFSNTPHITISFDKQIKDNLIEALTKLN